MAPPKTAQGARDVTAELAFLTRALKAPTLRESVTRLAERARAESWTHEEFLAACLQREVAAREFDEAIYVLSGRLLVVGEEEPQEAAPGSMFVAPRGNRHGFSNPFGEEARVLGLWAPPEPALAFMREIGASLTPDTPPDPDHMREIYARHASRLLPDN